MDETHKELPEDPDSTTCIAQRRTSKAGWAVLLCPVLLSVIMAFPKPGLAWPPRPLSLRFFTPLLLLRDRHCACRGMIAARS